MMDDRRRLLPEDDVSIAILPGGNDDGDAESSRVLGGVDEEEEEEMYGTFQRRSRSPQPPSPPDKTSRLRQTVSTLGFCLGALAMGNALGWSSTAVPNLGRESSSANASLIFLNLTV